MINYKKNNINNNSSGFTLIETLVALFIFSVSIISVMSVLSGSSSQIGFIKNRMAAGYLSQEGIEYLRNMRDTFSVDTTNGWTNFYKKLVDASCEPNAGCYFDNDENNFDPTNPIASIPIINCNGSCPNFKYNSQSGKYSYNSSDDSTPLSRKIIIKAIDDNNLIITSEVTWNKGDQIGKVSLSENLSNWIQ